MEPTHRDNRIRGAITRRRLLIAGAGAGVAAVAGRYFLDGDPDAYAVAQELFEDEEAARWMGNLYLESVPHRPSRTELATQLFPKGPPRSGGGNLLRERILGEYRGGRTLEVDGWRVAESELTAAALLAAPR